MATIVDIYCRTAADDEGTKAKLEQQEEACRAYCQECGLTIGKVFHEVAPGSTYRERELLSVMRARYRSGTTQSIVVTTLDRLSRSYAHQVILLQELAAHDAAFYCVQDPASDIAGRIVSMLLDIVTEIDREKAIDASLAD